MKLEEIDIRGTKIETNKLILRPFEEKDADDLYEYAQKPGVGEASGWKHHESRDESVAVLNIFIKNHRTFAIVEKESGKVIGSIGLEKGAEALMNSGLGENINDLGYVLSSDYWGKGYAAEAVRGLLGYAFCVLKLDAVTCGLFANNEGSKKIIEKCGFRLMCDGKYTTPSGESADALYYAITKESYGKAA